jgi:PHD/YefM family antitoxin component YafN of YafNO toxin-antitoxin module
MVEPMLSISEAQRDITKLPEQFEDDPKAITVTRYGKPVMAILPFETYEEYETMRGRIVQLEEEIESLQETLEILRDDELMASIRRGMEDIKAGRVYLLEDVKKELGLE